MVNIDIVQEIDGVKGQIVYAIYRLGLVLSLEEDAYNNLTEELQDSQCGVELSRHIDAVELAIGRLQDVVANLN